MDRTALVGPKGEKRLTDLTWTAATCGWGQVLVDRSTSNGDLIVNDKKVAYGIGTHAESLIEYQLPEGYTRFKARGGLDQGGVSQPTGATVRFLVFTQDPIQDRSPRTIAVSLADLGLKGTCSVRDLWDQVGPGRRSGDVRTAVAWHGAGLYLIRPGRPRRRDRANGSMTFLAVREGNPCLTSPSYSLRLS